MATSNYRYVARVGENEKDINVHIKEMIHVIKHEEVKTNLYVKGVKLSSHAVVQCKRFFGVNESTATRKVKDLLKNAIRIGTVLAFDGRQNVMYAYDKTAIILSPDLKTVVTVNKYFDNVMYSKFEQVKDILSNKELVELHLALLADVEREERMLEQRILEIEREVSEATEMYQTIIDLGRGRSRKRSVKSMISENNFKLKKEGRVLFNLKVEKRHICKSLVNLV